MHIIITKYNYLNWTKKGDGMKEKFMEGTAKREPEIFFMGFVLELEFLTVVA